MRLATMIEEKAFLSVMSQHNGVSVLELSELNFQVWVLDRYISDGPGYIGPIGIIIWGGGPECMTTFIKENARWQLCRETN